MPFTSDDLVAAVRLRAFLPDASDVTAANILATADEEQSSTLADIVRNIDPSWWLTEATHALVSGTSTYRLPGRSFGAGAERVEIVDSTGRREPVTPIDLADAWRFALVRGADWPGRFGFVVMDDELALYPPPASQDVGLTLSVRYQRQPSALVPVASCVPVVSIDSATVATVTGTPPASMQAGQYVDYVRGDGSFPALASERLVFDASAGALEVDASTPWPAALIATPPAHRADYLCPTAQACYPRVPANLWPVLVLATVRTILAATGDMQGARDAEEQLEARIVKARSVTTPRARQTPAFINRDSYLRRGR